MTLNTAGRPSITVVLACTNGNSVSSFFTLIKGGAEDQIFTAAARQGRITGSKGSNLELLEMAGGDSFLLIVPIGPSKKVTANTLRAAAGRACAYLRTHPGMSDTTAMWFTRGSFKHRRHTYTPAEMVELLAEGWGMRNDRITLSDKKAAAERAVQPLMFLMSGPSDELETAVQQARISVECIRWLRATGNLRANETSAEDLVDRSYAFLEGLPKTTVHRLVKPEFFEGKLDDDSEHPNNSERMGAFLSVNAGSRFAPAGILAHYSCGVEGALKVCFNGKGVWFDTGGIQKKGGKAMYEMHWDKMGAIQLIALFKYLVQIGIEVDLSIMCLFTDNGDECIPGDIVLAGNNLLIEVYHTDAEGRMLLIDAMNWIAKYLKPDYIVDAATLTGAVCEALGGRVGMFTSDECDPQMTQLFDLIEPSGILFTSCPVAYEKAGSLKSHRGDLLNTGKNGRDNGHGTAALFLVLNLLASCAKHGIDPNAITLWHFDIAGMMTADETDYHELREANPGPFIGWAWAFRRLVKPGNLWAPVILAAVDEIPPVQEPSS